MKPASSTPASSTPASSTPASSTPASTADLKRTIGRLLSTMSLFSALAAALIGTVATIFLGPALAMGASFYTGNTEPVTPSAPYPWGTLLGIAAVGAVGVALIRGQRHEATGHIVLHLAAVAAALLPFVHVFNLWTLANTPISP